MSLNTILNYRPTPEDFDEAERCYQEKKAKLRTQYPEKFDPRIGQNPPEDMEPPRGTFLDLRVDDNGIITERWFRPNDQMSFNKDLCYAKFDRMTYRGISLLPGAVLYINGVVCTVAMAGQCPLITDAHTSPGGLVDGMELEFFWSCGEPGISGDGACGLSSQRQGSLYQTVVALRKHNIKDCHANNRNNLKMFVGYDIPHGSEVTSKVYVLGK